MAEMQYFYDKQVRRYIQQFIRLFSGFSVQMGESDEKLPVMQKVPVRYGDINRMAAHITRENSENIVNTVPFISCYINTLNLAPERRTYQQSVDSVQVFEKATDESTGEYTDNIGSTYTVQRHNPVPYMMEMNVDVWTSNTDQKLQLLEQILVLFNPTLNIRTSDNPFDWTSLSYVEMTNILWSSRSIGSTIDDIIDVATMTFQVPVLITPPAKLKKQTLIHTIIDKLHNTDDPNLDLFRENEPFEAQTNYVVIAFKDRKLEYINGVARILNNAGKPLNDDGTSLTWEQVLKPYGQLRPGISQVRLRKSNNIEDASNDIVGKLSFSTNDNELDVDIDTDTLPTNTLNPVDGVLDPTKNIPGQGNVPSPTMGNRYIITKDLTDIAIWGGLKAKANDIIEYNGSDWVVSFVSSQVSLQQYVKNIKTDDQLEWNGSDWFNSFEGLYKPGFWRIYL
jgi:hypothetical protein